MVTDAGTPLISDPGYRIVSGAIAEGITVVPVPGPAAAIAALMASGLPTDAFYFGGFLPPKKGQRRALLERIRNEASTVVFYEAPHRILESLSDIVEVLGPTSADEVALVIRRARGLIVPSRIESLPLVMCDALQMNVPILVTDVGDMGRLVREHDAGIVCQPNVSSLARALVEFARAPGGTASGRDALRQLLDIRGSARRFLADIAAEPR